MSYTWNVYKIFKNGKRAKAPLSSFNFDGNEREADDHFHAVVLENFEEKYRVMQFSVIRDDLPQQREQKQDETLRKQTQILARLARNANITEKRHFSCGLIFAKTTNWNWQWCALQSGTNVVLASLSPQFKTHGDADSWMQKQIQTLK